METKPVLGTLNRENAQLAVKDKKAVADALNRILQMELAGTVLYTHYALVVCGNDCLPFIKWLEGQADESLRHAKTAGSLLTQLGAHPSLGIAHVSEIEHEDTNSILRASLAFEKTALSHYVTLLEMVQGDTNAMLEEYARQHVYLEMQHIGEIEKMLRRPGDLKKYEAA